MDGYKVLCEHRKKKSWNFILCNRKSKCVKVSWDHKKSLECLWIRTSGVITEGEFRFGVCHWPPNQNGEADETFLWQLKELLGPQSLVAPITQALVRAAQPGRSSSSSGTSSLSLCFELQWWQWWGSSLSVSAPLLWCLHSHPNFCFEPEFPHPSSSGASLCQQPLALACSCSPRGICTPLLCPRAQCPGKNRSCCSLPRAASSSLHILFPSGDLPCS